jgi:hypothetical protein
MELIAKSLITGQNIANYIMSDTAFVRDKFALTPFIWLVQKTGTQLFQLYDIQKITELKQILDNCETDTQSNYCLYRYDGKNLFPVFPQAMCEWVDNHLSILIRLESI